MPYFGIEEKPYYSVQEAAALLQLGISKTWMLLSEGKIRRIKVGRKTFVPADEIKRIWEEGTR